MATIARTRGINGSALVLLLGAAVFLNYIDRGAIGGRLAADEIRAWPVGDHLRFRGFGFFLDLRPGAAVARLAVRPLLGLPVARLGMVLWSVSTLLMGFVGGFVSLFLLRILLGIGESISFPAARRSLPAMSRPRRGHCQCRGGGRHRARPGGRHARRRARSSRRAAGGRCSSYSGRRRCSGCCRGGRPSGRFRRTGHLDQGARRAGPQGGWQMGAVGDVDRPCARQLLLLFPARLAPLCSWSSSAASRSPR